MHRKCSIKKTIQILLRYPKSPFLMDFSASSSYSCPPMLATFSVIVLQSVFLHDRTGQKGLKMPFASISSTFFDLPNKNKKCYVLQNRLRLLCFIFDSDLKCHRFLK